jgi:hypothetical protein
VHLSSRNEAQDKTFNKVRAKRTIAPIMATDISLILIPGNTEHETQTVYWKIKMEEVNR